MLNSILIKELREYKNKTINLQHKNEKLQTENLKLKNLKFSNNDIDSHIKIECINNELIGTDLKRSIMNISETSNQPLRFKKFKCEICKKEITGKYNFKVHIENVHEKLKKYKCDKCDKNFTQKIGLKLHSTAIHEKMKKIN